MGLTISLDGFSFQLDEQTNSHYLQRENLLRDLEKYSKSFFDSSNLEEILVNDTTFANPTWITLGTNIDKIKQQAEKYKQKWDHLIIGNGGSVEPAWAIYKALLESDAKKRFVLVDSPNPDDLVMSVTQRAKNKILKNNTIVYAVSKSGNTLNVILQTLTFMKEGYTIVPITENKPSTLRDITERANLEVIEHTNVGGRFTGNQPNTIIPLYALAMDSKPLVNELDNFIKAINEMGQKIRPDVPLKQNIAKKIALLLYKAELAGYNEIYMPIYSKKLMGAAGLVTQLVHESYGKNLSGQTILVMEGPECQHHTNQRFFGGQRNMVGIFVGVENYNNEIVADVSEFEDTDLKGIGELKALQGSKFSDLLKYERMGAYMNAKSAGIPIIDIVLDSVDGDSVGKFMGLMQGVVMYSAFLRGNKWEDQPAVEDSKNKTIELCMSKNPVFEYRSSSIRV